MRQNRPAAKPAAALGGPLDVSGWQGAPAGSEITEVANATAEAIRQLRTLADLLDLLVRDLHDNVDPALLCDSRDSSRSAVSMLKEIELDLRAVRGQLRSAAVLAEPAMIDLGHLRPRSPADDDPAPR